MLHSNDKKDITELIFGIQVYIDNPKFKRLFKKNPYIFGEWDENGKIYTVYIGKDGIKVVPFSPEVFEELIRSIRIKDEGKYIYTDGNTMGFCILFIEDGKVKDYKIFKNSATSNFNELKAVLKAYEIFGDLPIFSDSKYAVSKAKKINANIKVIKTRAHSGVLWNSISDLILRYLLPTKI